MRSFLSFISRFDDSTPIDNGDGQPINQQQLALLGQMRKNLGEILEPIHSDRYAKVVIISCLTLSWKHDLDFINYLALLNYSSTVLIESLHQWHSDSYGRFSFLYYSFMFVSDRIMFI